MTIPHNLDDFFADVTTSIFRGMTTCNNISSVHKNITDYFIK